MESNCVKWVRLGDYISQRRENNSSLKYGVDLIEGVNSDSEFQPTKAITDNINLKPYKVVRHGDIVYNCRYEIFFSFLKRESLSDYRIKRMFAEIISVICTTL